MSAPWTAWLTSPTTPPGVYRATVQVASPRRLAALTAQGWHVAVLDGSQIGDKAALLAALYRAFAVPADAGHNWDALEEVLCDLSWLPARGYLLCYDHADRLAATHPATWRTALAIFQHTAAVWQADTIPFFTLVRAPRLPHRLPWLTQPVEETTP